MRFWTNGATAVARRISLEEPSRKGRRAFAHTIPISGRSFGAPIVGVTVRGEALQSVALAPRVLQIEPQEWQFAVPLPVDGMPTGRQRLEIILAMADGETIAIDRSVVIDPAGAYSRHRHNGGVKQRPPTTLTADGIGAPTVLVAPVGEAALAPHPLEASLEAQSYRGFEVLGAGGGGIATLSVALRQFLASSHDWLLIVEEEGALTRDALLELMAAAQRHDDPDVVYGDDECAAAAPGVPTVRLKPAWSPDLLLGSPYVGPVAAVGRAAAAAALRENGPDPLDIRELLLRLDTSLARVVHVAHSLFVRSAARESVQLPLERPDRAPPPRPCVSAVICTAYRDEHVFDCLRSLGNGHRGEQPLEVVLVDDGSPARARALALCEEVGLPVQALTYPPPFNFSDASNLGAGSANGSELLFVNDDIEALDGPWLERMRAWLHRPGVGLVGPKLIYPSGRLQHAGVAVGPWRVDNLGRGWPDDRSGPGGVLGVARNTTAVTGACMLIDRELFDALGGFDPRLAIEFGDVDLPLRAAMAGARTVWTPEATLVHHEGMTRRTVTDRHDWEHFRARWEPILDGCDPFMHPGFDVDWDYEPARRLPLHRSSREPLWSRARADRSVAAGPERRGQGAMAAARNRRMAMARAESRYLTDQRGTARDALETVMRSRSWRYTRPLRSVAAFFRRG